MSLRKVLPGSPGTMARLLLLVGVVALSGCGGDYPQSTLTPLGDFAKLVDDLFSGTVRWAVLVFVLVEGALIYAILKFRARPGDAEPQQTHGNALVEVVWTIIPAVILAFIAVPTVRTIFQTAEVPEDALEIEVIGHQWWWEFRYPSEGVVTATEMHVPAGQKVVLKMRTADVLHSFWVPQFAAKRDVFQNKYTTMWFTADTIGRFPGQCAEFCGIQHARMHSWVVVQPPEEFAAWVTAQQVGSPLVNRGVVAVDTTQAPAVPDSVVIRGEAAFVATGCISCHAMVGTPLAGQLFEGNTNAGPNLSHVASRRHLAGGLFENTEANLRRWLRDPQGLKPGSNMRLPRPLTDDEIDVLVAYLQTRQ